MYDQLLQLKYLGVFVLALLFPIESVMPLIGHFAAAGSISFTGAIIAGTAGSATWATLIYFLASFVSARTRSTFVNTHGAWLGLSHKNIERAGRWFDRNAPATVLFGRFAPGVRTAVSVPAGIRHMPLGLFMICTICGSGLWVTLMASLGYLAHTEYARIQATANYTSEIIGFGAIGLVIIFLLWQRKK